jgi:mono/diheme cytochrome c family protein
MKNCVRPAIFGLLTLLLVGCGSGSEDEGVAGTPSTDGGTTTIPRDQQNTGNETDGENQEPSVTDEENDQYNTGGGTGDNPNDDTGTNVNNNPDDNMPSPPEDEPEPSIGESFYGFLCVSCHGLDGAGTVNAPSLIRLWDPVALQNKIASEMPPTDPIACSGLCAQTTSEYIAQTFRPADPNVNNPPPPPPQPFALIHSEDDLTNFAPHNIALEARFTGISGTPLIQWYLDEQLEAEGINYNADFVLPGQHALQLVITGQDDVRVVVNEVISIMAEDHAVDQCSPPIEFYAVKIGPAMVDIDCDSCHRDNGPAASSGLHFERLTVRGALTNNYNALGRYADNPNTLLQIVGGNGHDAGERLNLSNTNTQLYQDLSTFLNIDAETPLACLEQ